MPNEFIARNGVISRGNLIVSGSLVTTQPTTFSGSLSLTGDLNFQPGATRYISMSASPTTASGDSIIMQAGNATAGGTGGSLYFRIGTGAGGPGSGAIYIGNQGANSVWPTIDISGPTTIYNSGPNTGTTLTVNGGGQLAMRWDWDNINLVTSAVSSGNRILRFTGASQYQVRGSGATSSTTAFQVQNANASASLSVRDNGYVGIGTSSPAYNLDVSGTIRTTGVSTNGVIFSDGTYGAKAWSNGYIFTIEKEGTYGPTTYLFKYSDGSSAINLSGTSIIGIGGGDDGVMMSRNVYAPHNAAFGFTSYGSTTKYKAIQAVFTDSSASGVAFNYRTGSTDIEAIRLTSAGRVGIGTTSPSAKLDVSGSIRVRANYSYNTDFSGGVTNQGILSVDVYDSVVLGSTYATGGIVALTSGFRYDFKSTGLGINTASPSAALHVKGSGTTSSTTSLLVQNSSGTNILTVQDSGQVGIGTTALTGSLDVVGGPIVVKTAASTARGLHLYSHQDVPWRITTNSNTFAIYAPRASTNAAVELINLSDYVDAALPILSFKGGMSGMGYPHYWGINANQTASYTSDFVVKGTLANTYAIGVATTGDKLTAGITPAGGAYFSGSVGIGTNSPAYALDVNGTTRIQNQLEVLSTTSAQGLLLKHTALSTTAAQLWYYASNAVTYLDNLYAYTAGDPNIGSITFRSKDASNTLTSRVFIQGSSGNVGIGTTTPTDKLQILGDVGVGTGVSQATLKLYNHNATNYASLYSLSGVLNILGPAGSNGIVIDTNANSSFIIKSNGVESLRILNNQNVGIGTSTPAYKLDVNGSTNITGSLTVTGSITATGALTASSAIINGNLTVIGTASFTYTTASVVNIGGNLINLNTDNPASRFGGMTVTDSGSFGTSSTGSLLWDSQNNRWIYSNPSGSSYDGGLLISGPRNTSGLGSEEGTTLNALMKGQGGDHITSSGVFEVSGNVGIGTSTPSYKLDVAGNIIARTTYPSIYVDHSGTILGGVRADATVKLELKTLTTAPLSFQVNSDEKMRITDSGTVGIGTYTPTARLHVKGSGTTSSTTALLVENANTSGSMVVLDDGNVGIGTAAPTEKLTVNGNTIVGLAAQLGTENAKLKVKAGYEGGAMNGALIEANGATSTLILRHTGNASNSILIDNTNAGTTGMGAGIRINASNNITNFVSFSNSGSTKFLIGGTGDIYVSGSSGGTATFEGTIQSTLNLKAGAKNNYLVGQTNGVLSFRPDGVTAMDINSLGNVSIGTTTPSSRLQVQGSGTTSATTAFRVENANASASL